MASVGRGFRGRGRARNLSVALSRPGENNQANNYSPLNSNPPTESNVIEKSLAECLRNPSKQNRDSFVGKVINGAHDDSLTVKVVGILSGSIEERDQAEAAGEIASSLTEMQFGGIFRTQLLKKVQEFYKTREELAKDFNRYLGFTTLLSSIFKWVKVSGQPLKPLTTPVYAVLNELLDGKSEGALQREEEIETFHNNLLMVGNLLEESDKEKMDELFKKVRNTILKKSSPKMRCLLLETLEYYASGNWTVDKDIKTYYTDMLSDIMAKT